MTDAKPIASLTAGLLARKGHAKPAMRPGGAHLNGGHDDLGWNDMGTPVPTVVMPAVPAPVTTVLPDAAPMPEVVRQQAEVAREFAPEPAPSMTFAEAGSTSPFEAEPVPAIVPTSRARGLDTGKSKAAFTLRLDADRHLRLRLACAVSHRSAQQIVTQALDAFLSQRPDIDALADQLPAPVAASKN